MATTLLALMAHDARERILSFLPPQNAIALAKTCRLMRTGTADTLTAKRKRYVLPRRVAYGFACRWVLSWPQNYVVIIRSNIVIIRRKQGGWSPTFTARFFCRSGTVLFQYPVSVPNDLEYAECLARPDTAKSGCLRIRFQDRITDTMYARGLLRAVVGALGL